MSSRSFRLEEATIDDIHSAFRSGELSCRRLVELYLARIEAYDKSGPELNSIITINPNVLEEAEKLDRSFERDGELVGPLHGVPVLVKDQAETAGIRTTFGSIAFEDYTPEDDATVVRRLKEAGAIILAKTNLPDFATSWFAYSSAGGETKNPYALDRDPGGSSSGTGAAIAANLGAVGIGEDTDESGNEVVQALPGMAIVGSSNFTLSGVSSNTELNVEVTGAENHAQLKDWFEDLWGEAEDFDEALMREMERSWAGATPSPYDVYMKALYTLVRDRLEGERETNVLAADEITDELADFQRVAFRQAVNIINEHGGVFVADVVGLGKSYIGSAIVKYFEQTERARPLIVCPKSLVTMWETLQRALRAQRPRPLPQRALGGQERL